jgi:thermitase
MATLDNTTSSGTATRGPGAGVAVAARAAVRGRCSPSKAHGYKIVNVIYAGPEFSQTEANAAAYAWARGVVLVAAAANNYDPKLMYPAAYPEVAVAATDWHDNLAAFSSFGKTWVSVPPPGTTSSRPCPTPCAGYRGTIPTGATGGSRGLRWRARTSPAPPHSSGPS